MASLHNNNKNFILKICKSEVIHKIKENLSSVNCTMVKVIESSAARKEVFLFT